MVYIFEAELAENKSVFAAVRSIYGIGKSRASLICKKLGFSSNFKCGDLSKEQINKLIYIIESFKFDLASSLKVKESINFDRLLAIRSYRGIRKNQGFPVRGQRTRSNASTADRLKPIKQKTMKQYIKDLQRKQRKLKLKSRKK